MWRADGHARGGCARTGALHAGLVEDLVGQGLAVLVLLGQNERGDLDQEAV